MTDDEIADLLLDAFGSHVVAFRMRYRQKSRPLVDQSAVFSGTIAILGNAGYVVTAGHCLKEIEKVQSSADHCVLSFELADFFGPGNPNRMPIPISGAKERLVWLDKGGVDIGVIQLDFNQVRLLAANGVRAIKEEEWKKAPLPAAKDGFLFGFPDAGQTSGPGWTSAMPAVLPLHKVVSDTRLQDGRFEAETHPEFETRFAGGPSLSGMSGGPIVVVQRDPWAYSVVAVQSAQKGTRIYGTYIQSGIEKLRAARLLGKVAI